MKQAFLLFLIAILFISCNDKSKSSSELVSRKAISKKSPADTASREVLTNSTDFRFFADSVLHGHMDIIKYYFKKYSPDSCNHFPLNKSQIVNSFQGLEYIGDINHNNTPDSVFVLGPINFCRFKDENGFEGDAYYFTDTTLPRIQTNSECCHPRNLFLVGDIDEDGISELGQFFSSCASHYKSLYIYSLKNNKWKEVGHSIFDLFYMDVNKPYSSWVRKTNKNKFEMLQITDLTEKNKIGKKDWLKFTM